MATLARAGFNITMVRGVDPADVLLTRRAGARRIHCESCERPLASVQNFIATGLVNMQILCECGTETSIVLTARP